VAPAPRRDACVQGIATDDHRLESPGLEASMTVDLNALFLPDMHPVEIFVRGTVVYIVLFLLLRLALKRQSGGVGMTDLLVVILIADAAQNAMAGDYHSITDGVLLVATILGWAYAIDWLGYHVPAVERIVHPPPLPLVADGHLLRRNMRTELITYGELMSQLRAQGIDDVARVHRAYLEGNGELTVIPVSEQTNGGRRRRRAAT
jgi:uncharacterized membrane protein YcaP (DUF421 family)